MPSGGRSDAITTFRHSIAEADLGIDAMDVRIRSVVRMTIAR